MNYSYQILSFIILLLTIGASVIAIIRIRSWFTFLLVVGIAGRIFFFLTHIWWLRFYGGMSYSYSIINLFAWVFDLIFAAGLIGLALNTRKRDDKYAQQGYDASLVNYQQSTGTSMPYSQAGMIPAAFVRSWPHSFSFYFVSLLVCGIISMPLSWLSLAATINDAPEAGMMLSFITFPISIFGLVVFCMFLYHAWWSIQPYGVRTTPGKAVGFCFIPFFNFYWIFHAIYGLAKDFNKIVRERSLHLNFISEGLALTYCILILVSIVPIIGILAGIVSFVLLLVFIGNVYKAIDGLNKAGLITAPSTEPPTQISTSPASAF
ncbi:MAG: hypothetical protein JW787_10540 [Sedimentisphaerales bacterium]|nr:hypothetical protein [Sedimentisphaerales bacterium]